MMMLPLSMIKHIENLSLKNIVKMYESGEGPRIYNVFNYLQLSCDFVYSVNSLLDLYF